MRISFPIFTIPSKEVTDFLGELEDILNSPFSEAIVLSPFVDAHIVVNFIKRCMFDDRKLSIVTRYRTVPPSQQNSMDKAKQQILGYGQKDPSIIERVDWTINERLHAKCVIIDWKTILFGSQNLTQFGGLGHSGRGNYELGALIEGFDERTAKHLKSFFQEVSRTSSRRFYP